MERIASFCVDHTKLDRGMYLSRQDGDVLTWDIRMKRPNHGDYLSTGAAHTLEHLFATYARNSAFQDSVICSFSRANISILSAIPLVDKEIWRCPMLIPSGQLTRCRNLSTLS